MRIYVWGTGRLAGKVIGKYIGLDGIEAFIDNDEKKTEYMHKMVIRPESLKERGYDAILVANLYCEEIHDQCMKIGIDLDKVIFLYNNCKLEDANKDYKFVEKVLGEKMAETVQERYHVVRGTEAFDRPYVAGRGGYRESDYVRIECFELAVKEIYKRKIEGAVAEVGVFRGEFAQYINEAFPDRKFYLFDTFEGFDANEALREVKNGNCSDAFVEAYKQTDIVTVLKKMKYIQNVIVKQGYFPQSLDGLEERFAFVSLDVDFEESIYEGIRYFYPRLSAGGYLFVHDYNSDLRGVESAVDRYEAEQKMYLCKVPICDANGTLVVTKG